ncbi:hypothetical protein [Actinomadura terrae]|uniref:hypothetical protein n=1 Tax=Actinomadura terrae TaxID=604353 RepID=UPI001FA75E81|nr:hypothetical protein [Actinomadura terrae]
MRAMNNPESDPFAKSKKKGKRKNNDFRAANLAGNRRNARQMPTRQLNRGR